MPMDYIGAFVVLAALLGVYSVMIRGMRPKDGRFTTGLRPLSSLRDIARAGSADSVGWAATLLGLLALASMLSDSGAPAGQTGAGLGLACALLGVNSTLAKLREWLLSGIGVVAALYGFRQLMSDDSCSDFSARGLLLILTLMAFAVGLFIALLRFKIHATVGLQAFVVIELVTFLSAPLGVDLVGGQMWIAFGVAVCLGFLTGLGPQAILSLVGVGLAAAALFGSTLTSDGCGLNGSNDQIVLMVSGMVVYLLVSGLISRFR